MTLAALAFLAVIAACTPKTADKTAATRNPAIPEQNVEWDTIGKPLMGEDAEMDEEASGRIHVYGRSGG